MTVRESKNQAWNANDEYAYYDIHDQSAVQKILARQTKWEEECFFTGFVAARNLGVLHKKFLHRSKVLELGAGECFLSAALIRAGASEVYALDAVPAQIWAAAMRNSSRSTMHFCLSDASDLPFQDASFDVVLSYCFLHHIEPLTTVFSEAFRVLRPGGFFFAMEPSWLHKSFNSVLKKKGSKNERAVKIGSYKRALKSSGYKSYRVHNAWPSLQLVHARLPANLLGPLSPQVLIKAQKQGNETETTVKMRRACVPTVLPNLYIDTGCKFADLAEAQCRDIANLLQREGGKIEG
jgi:SAM-dependent methyltransferase